MYVTRTVEEKEEEFEEEMEEEKYAAIKSHQLGWIWIHAVS